MKFSDAAVKPLVERIAAIIGDEVEAIIERLRAAEKEARDRIAAVGPPVEFDYNGAAEYLHKSRRALEGLVAAHAIGFRRDGKRVFFTKAALDDYRAAGTFTPRRRRPLTL